MKVVRIRWLDSVSDSGWVTREEALARAEGTEVLHADSVGYLLSETEDYMLLAASYMHDGDLVQGVLQIPGHAVRGMDLLHDDEDA